MRKSTSLENPLLGVSLALLAMLLCAPSLRLGWIFDDHSHRASLTMMGRSPADLFDFVDEEPPRSNLPCPSRTTNPFESLVNGLH